MATHSDILVWRSHRQRSLGGYSLQGHTESDTTEWLQLVSWNNAEKKRKTIQEGAPWWSAAAAAAVAAAAKSLQSCPTLCDPIDGSPPGSPVPGILQARTLEWVCHFLLQCMKVKSEREVAQSCLTLSDPMDYSPPGSSVHGIFQARVLEWGAIAFSTMMV